MCAAGIGVATRHADLGDPAVVEPLTRWLDGVDAVIHLAWQIQPSHHRERLRRTNVDGTRHLIEAVRRTRVPALVYASSVGAYAPGPKDRGIDESHPHTGVGSSTYSVDKAAVEAILDQTEQEEPSLRIVRLRKALIFQHDAGAEIARLFLGPLVPVSLLRLGRLPLVPANPLLRAQVVHADDVAQAYLRALRTDVTGAFNIATEPVLDADLLAGRLRGRTVQVSLPVLHRLVAVTWRARLQPSEPGRLDLAAAAPIMDCTRAALRGGRPSLRDLLNALPGQRDPA